MGNTTSDRATASIWYDRYKKRFNKRYICAWIYLIIGMSFSLLLFLVALVGVSNYIDSKEEVAELEKERSLLREKRQPSMTDDFLKKFEESQEELTHDWQTSKDSYTVTISGQELLIDRKNIFVSDNAKVLKNETKRKVYQMNKEFSQFKDGQQLMVVTIQSLPKSATIESFATELFNQLGIGQADKNNGVLFMMSIDDRKTRIEVGYGLEATMTDAQAGSILENEETVSDFRDEEYDTGINRILAQLYSRLGSTTPEYDLKIKNAEEELSSTTEVIIFLVVCSLLFLVSSVLIFIKNKKLRKQMNQLSEDDIYFLYLTGTPFIFSVRKLKARIDTGRIMSKHTGAVRKGKNILVGNYLYDSTGAIITRDYTSYNSSSDSNSSGDSFGGGSSGGGGASGGW